MQQGNDLQQKRVVVLGGSSGIGLAVAEQAASQGANIVIASSSAERVQKAVERIGGEAQGKVVEASDEQAVESFFVELDPFDHLVFTAGDSLRHTVLVPSASVRRKRSKRNAFMFRCSLWEPLVRWLTKPSVSRRERRRK
jgi:NAD(P)-dependent dehydrogenase (short-subunit alcohol dehydrogenase family)